MPSPETYLCLDFGSTFTKGLLVAESGEVLGSAAHRTTIETDVMDAYDAIAARLPGFTEVLACSSAGGGLRILVVGQEELVTAEAGRRLALSSGGAVVGVVSRPYDARTLAAQIERARPDVVLLTGGTDGGNAEPLLGAARDLVAGRWRGPVVIAGNTDAAPEAAHLLAGWPVVTTSNVLPRIGVLDPEPARTAIREIFLTHVIGGKQLSSRADFARLVRGATPDIVLTGVETLAAAADLPHGVAVIDVGGATTDVHSVVRLDAETGDLGREVVAATPVTRTVEADLGMRWSAVSTAEAAHGAGLAEPDLVEVARRRRDDVGFAPRTTEEYADDAALARAASVLALRRHVGRSRVVVSPEGRVVERTGQDLRQIELLIGSGGVFRHASAEAALGVLRTATGPSVDGWQQPDAPALAVDQHHVLPAVGLLADRAPQTADALARTLLGAARS